MTGKELRRRCAEMEARGMRLNGEQEALVNRREALAGRIDKLCLELDRAGSELAVIDLRLEASLPEDVEIGDAGHSGTILRSAAGRRTGPAGRRMFSNGGVRP